MSLARVTVSGIVQNEPEKRFTPNNIGVTNFSILVSPAGRNETPFQVRVTCWRGLADVVVEQLHKGDLVTVEGRLQVNQYEGPAGGSAKRAYEVDASNVYKGQLVPLIVEGQQGATGGTERQQSQSYRPQQQPQQQQPQPAYGQAPQQPVPAGVSAPMGGGGESFTNEDILTEDDIPF